MELKNLFNGSKIIMENKIGIIGLGYVGLPLAIAFSEHYKVLGFDIDNKRILELKESSDVTSEIDTKTLSDSSAIFTNNINDLRECNIYIVTVPTPIYESKTPNLSFLKTASENISRILKKNDYVIFESTVYPGCTEEFCVPLLEKYSFLEFNKDFFVGYSPERINPGDKINSLASIVKVTSGSNKNAADFVDKIYNKIIKAGTFRASSIKVAEASKAIENAQRDLNISFVNELAVIFDRFNIDTTEVLEAAGTKWNFLNFKPGLVGGHCISVDPYYLTYKSEIYGYSPQVILSGRKVNDEMPQFISAKCVKLMIKKGINILNSKALILGAAFKENCPDIRNSKVPNIYNHLTEYGLRVDIFDPLADEIEFLNQNKIELTKSINEKKYDLIIFCVSHSLFSEIDIKRLKKSKDTVIYDVKSFLPKEIVDARL